jgi:hypothetical protein
LKGTGNGADYRGVTFMTCAECREWGPKIGQLILAGLEHDMAQAGKWYIQQHIAGCPSCQEYLAKLIDKPLTARSKSTTTDIERAKRTLKILEQKGRQP